MDSVEDADDAQSDLDALEQGIAAAGLGGMNEAELDEVIDLVDLQEQLSAEQEVNIKHAAIETPDSRCPFSDEGIAAFFSCLSELEQSNHIPAGLGVSVEEYGADGYPLVEHLEVGRRKKALDVELPHPIWVPRALRWARALELMNTFLSA